MKHILTILLLLSVGCASRLKRDEAQEVMDILNVQTIQKSLAPAAPAAPEPSWHEVYPFTFTLRWDANAPEDQVTGYNLYLGEQTLNYVAKIPLPNITEQRVLNNHPVTYCAVAAVNAVGEGELSDEFAYVRHTIP